MFTAAEGEFISGSFEPDAHLLSHNSRAAGPFDVSTKGLLLIWMQLSRMAVPP
jgi:hypothetical protein